jgi:hypothetical protein
MSPSRLSLLPATAFVPLVPDLNKHLAAVAESITAESLASIFDGVMKRLISGTFQSVTASEGSIWLHDSRKNSLVMAFNTGPNAGTLVGKFSQPLTAGIISMVFANEQGFVENHVSRNSQHDKTLDTKLHVRTESMIATPFYFLAACRGVISCVRLQQSEQNHERRGFSEQNLVTVRHSAAVLGKLVDEKVLRTVVGLS